jgi:hypothetical protein
VGWIFLDRRLALVLIALGSVLLSACTVGSSKSDEEATTGELALNAASSFGRYADYCDSDPDCPSGGVPAALRRPLDLPEVAPGEVCPTSSSHQLSPSFAPGLGDGPVYPLGAPTGVLPIQLPPFSAGHQFAGSQWGGEKVLWVSDPSYEGPILIRADQVDGPNAVRFDRDPSTLLSELQFPPDYAANYSGGWRNFPSHTRLRTSGCYAYQVDGTGFSTIIVFEAVAE